MVEKSKSNIIYILKALLLLKSQKLYISSMFLFNRDSQIIKNRFSTHFNKIDQFDPFDQFDQNNKKLF